ncbi:MAG: 3-phosphoserine/phosphohydroxythreonine transaminase [Burkholderiaceae bacterium]|jgi:phosphoserine aminotransferase|nr:3-phosphoserine/phosphohydroxythreonine transaminase [Burkholderiaceae bacterium]
MSASHRIFNFASGPAVLPEAVLRQAQDELLDWGGRGFSVLESSHRAAPFVAVIEETEALLRELLAVPRRYRVLFMQGGGHQQFAMVPINLLRAKFHADYLLTGHWSLAAAEEARRFCNVQVAADTAAAGAVRVPAQHELTLDPQAAYAYYCPNETIHGVEFDYVPATGGVPLVADASSSFLSRPIDVAAHGLIYACAQKNFGPAGLTAVIVRDDLVGHTANRWPTMLDYKTYADARSLWNTPATFAVYIAHLVLKWLKAQGGVAAIEQVNIAKSGLLYDTIDGSGGFYVNRVHRPHRSRMNVPFSLRDERLNDAFLAEAESAGLTQLKGHRSVGGMRASIYNAMPLAGVQALTAFMREFQRTHG